VTKAHMAVTSVDGHFLNCKVFVVDDAELVCCVHRMRPRCYKVSLVVRRRMICVFSFADVSGCAVTSGRGSVSGRSSCR